jgi:uncharacterized membrane protein
VSSKTLIFICAGITYPVLVHSSIIFGRPETAVLFFGTIAILLGLFQCFDVNNYGPKKGIIWVCIGACLIIFSLSKTFSQYALFFPPVLITSLILFSFANTLLKDKEPLVTRFARMMTDENLPQEIVQYTRNVTWMWTFILTAILVTCIALPIFAPIKVWSFFTNFFNYLIIIAFFVGEYIYRIYRFGHRYSLLHFFKTMSKVSFK